MASQIEEEKRVTKRWVLELIFIVVALVIYSLRLVDWQIINGAAFLERANTSNTYTMQTEAKRGEILDVNGVDLAVNFTGFKIVFDRIYLKEGTENEIILELISASPGSMLALIVADVEPFAIADKFTPILFVSP